MKVRKFGIAGVRINRPADQKRLTKLCDIKNDFPVDFRYIAINKPAEINCEVT